MYPTGPSGLLQATEKKLMEIPLTDSPGIAGSSRNIPSAPWSRGRGGKGDGMGQEEEVGRSFPGNFAYEFLSSVNITHQTSAPLQATIQHALELLINGEEWHLADHF